MDMKAELRAIIDRAENIQWIISELPKEVESIDRHDLEDEAQDIKHIALEVLEELGRTPEALPKCGDSRLSPITGGLVRCGRPAGHFFKHVDMGAREMW